MKEHKKWLLAIGKLYYLKQREFIMSNCTGNDNGIKIPIDKIESRSVNFNNRRVMNLYKKIYGLSNSDFMLALRLARSYERGKYVKV